jgi:hypothetical protein
MINVVISDNEAVPVLVGLAIGIGFIILFSTVFSVPTSFGREISKEKAVGIAVDDLTTKYIKNPPVIKIYAIVGNQTAAYPTVDTFLKEENYTLTMAYTAASGTFYFVDAGTLSLEECHVPYCPIPEQGMKALK